LVSLCLSHAQRAQANWAYAEIGSLIGESAQRYQFHSEKNAQEAEARVVWSNRLIAIAPLLIRLQAQGQLQATEELLSHLVEKAKEIAERRDVHYQGRMELLFLHNAKGLAMTHFLLAKAAPSPLTEEAQGLEEAWREQLLAADNSLADQISLTWLTTAQLSFPLAFWQAGPAGP
jgi:hypothetical protein